MIYGYCRISTRKQNIERQIRNIRCEYPEAVIVQEAYTGTKLDRKEWQKLICCVSSGDTIIFDSVSLMSRNAAEGVNRYMLALARKQIYLAFEQSEKEVADLHQRTKEGIETARLNGKQIGRATGVKVTTKKSVEAKQLIAEHSKDFGGSLDDSQMLKLVGLARNTYYKYKRELRAGA